MIPFRFSYRVVLMKTTLPHICRPTLVIGSGISPSSRYFHSSKLILGPKDSKKGNKKIQSDDQECSLPSLEPFKGSIARSIAWLQSEFDKNKFGSITPEYFQNLSVPGHGNLGKLGQITVRGGSHLSIVVYDTTLVSSVIDTIRSCGLNLNPVLDGTTIVASVPRPTKETRDLMIKHLAKLTEKIKTDIRGTRKDVIDGTKRVQDEFSKDDVKRHMKEIETIMEANLEKISVMMKAKEKELRG